MDLYLPIANLSVNALVIIGLGGLVGLLSGMFGVGGGFLTTPLLIFYGIPPTVAAASAASQVTGASVSGVVTHMARKTVDFRMGGVLIAGGTPTTHFYAGRALVHLSTDFPEGKQLVTSKLRQLLWCPQHIQFRPPRFQGDEQINEMQDACERVNGGRGLVVMARADRAVWRDWRRGANAPPLSILSITSLASQDGGLHSGAPRARLGGVVGVGARAGVRRRASGPGAGLVL